MAAADFFTKMLPYAQQASTALDIPASVIMGQWAVESDKGKSALAKKNNLGGIKYVNQSQASGSSGGFASYSSLDKFTEDYIRVMSLSYYKDVRAAGDVAGTVKALSLSPYDTGGYNGTGKSILDVVNQYGLTKFDNGGIKMAGANWWAPPEVIAKTTDKKAGYYDIMAVAGIGGLNGQIIAGMNNSKNVTPVVKDGIVEGLKTTTQNVGIAANQVIDNVKNSALTPILIVGGVFLFIVALIKK